MGFQNWGSTLPDCNQPCFGTADRSTVSLGRQVDEREGTFQTETQRKKRKLGQTLVLTSPSHPLGAEVKVLVPFVPSTTAVVSSVIERPVYLLTAKCAKGEESETPCLVLRRWKLWRCLVVGSPLSLPWSYTVSPQYSGAFSPRAVHHVAGGCEKTSCPERASLSSLSPFLHNVARSVLSPLFGRALTMRDVSCLQALKQQQPRGQPTASQPSFMLLLRCTTYVVNFAAGLRLRGKWEYVLQYSPEKEMPGIFAVKRKRKLRISCHITPHCITAAGHYLAVIVLGGTGRGLETDPSHSPSLSTLSSPCWRWFHVPLWRSTIAEERASPS